MPPQESMHIVLNILHMSQVLSAWYITQYQCLQGFNTIQGLHIHLWHVCELMSDDIDAPSSFDQHLCTWCAHLLALSTLMYHKTSITKTTHVHTSYQVTLVCIMLCQSIRMCLWRVDFLVSSSNFRFRIESRDVAVISIGNGQWSYNWYPRIVIISHASSAPFEW